MTHPISATPTAPNRRRARSDCAAHRRAHSSNQSRLGTLRRRTARRIALADPKILILDEATANIDSFNEQEIQIAMKRLRQGRTTIVIAHRLATVRDADRIVVLRAGRIVEQGTHDDLCRRDGLYAQLLASSHTSFDEEI